MIDVVVDVIDTRSGLLLASTRMSWTEAVDRLSSFFAGESLGYRMTETDQGLPRAVVFSYALNASAQE
jgi:hypothetical protein